MDGALVTWVHQYARDVQVIRVGERLVDPRFEHAARHSGSLTFELVLQFDILLCRWVARTLRMLHSLRASSAFYRPFKWTFTVRGEIINMHSGCTDQLTLQRGHHPNTLLTIQSHRFLGYR